MAACLILSRVIEPESVSHLDGIGHAPGKEGVILELVPVDAVVRCGHPDLLRLAVLSSPRVEEIPPAVLEDREAAKGLVVPGAFLADLDDGISGVSHQTPGKRRVIDLPLRSRICRSVVVVRVDHETAPEIKDPGRHCIAVGFGMKKNAGRRSGHTWRSETRTRRAGRGVHRNQDPPDR